MTRRFMLDNNREHLHAQPQYRAGQEDVRRRKAELCVSAVSSGETRSGLAQGPAAKRLAAAADVFFDLVEMLDCGCGTPIWRECELSFDMRADVPATRDADRRSCLEIGATLVTSDRAFRFVPSLAVENWIEDQTRSSANAMP